MLNSERVLIERKEGVTIYGKVINSRNKLGQYEVESKYLGISSSLYSSLSDAERRMDEMIGVSQRNQDGNKISKS